MKKLLLLTAFLSLFLLVKAQKFEISGTLTGANQEYVYLADYAGGKILKLDSVKMVSGKFLLKGKIELPEFKLLSVEGKQGYLPVFVESSKISVVGKFDSLPKARITGSVSQQLLAEYNKKLEPFNTKLKAMGMQFRDAQKINDKAKMDEIDTLYDQVDAQKKKSSDEFIDKNSNSVVAAYIIAQNQYSFSFEELQKATKKLSPSLAKSKYVVMLNSSLETLAKVQVGKQAPDFTLNDTLGKPLALSSLKGKFLLVDFWASWCGPCRAENPNVVAAYKEFSAKGFDVLGVSLDQPNARGKWIAAIQKDGLTWNHVSDLKYWECEAAKLYGVKSIPSNVLLDKNGVIIAKDLRGEALLKKLKELLN